MFKQSVIFVLSEDFNPSHDELREKLKRAAFSPCSALQMVSTGFSEVDEANDFVRTRGNHHLVCLKIEEKCLPAAAVKKAVNDACKELERVQGFKPGNKQKKEIKERILMQMLPKAPTKEGFLRAWFDITGRRLVVEGSGKKADMLIEALKIAFSTDGLPISLLRTATSPSAAMTQWTLTGEASDGITVGRGCTLCASDSKKSQIGYKNHTLDGPEVADHIRGGKVVSALDLCWEDKIEFTLTENGELKKIKPMDALNEYATENDIIDPVVLMLDVMPGFLAAQIASLGGVAE